MHGSGDQLLARAALAAYQDRRVAGRDLPDELVNLMHPLGVTDHVVGDADLVPEPLVLTLQPVDVSGVFERDGGDACNAGQQMEMVFVEPRRGMGADEINHTKLPAEVDQRDAQHGRRSRSDQALAGIHGIVDTDGVTQDSDAVPQDLIDESSAVSEGIFIALLFLQDARNEIVGALPD